MTTANRCPATTAHGQLLPGYEDADTPERERDPNKPVAAPVFKYRRDAKYELAEGKMFRARRFEAVLGSGTAAKEHLHVGSTFRATHGFPGPNEVPDVHKPTWTVVGILKPTHTANDRVLFVPCVSLYCIEEHEIGLFYQTLMKAGVDPARLSAANFPEAVASAGMKMEDVPEDIRKRFGELTPPSSQPEAAAPASQSTPQAEEPEAYHVDPATGDIIPDVPPSQWQLSAILVRTRGGFQAQQLMYNFKVANTEATAVNPASVMCDFFQTFLKGSTTLLLVISYLVTVVAAVAILVSIYNSVSAQPGNRHLACLGGNWPPSDSDVDLRRGRVRRAAGALLGYAAGHLIGAVESIYFNATLGQSINWRGTDYWEVLYLIATVAIAVLAGLVPAPKAYRTPVATNLVAA